MKSVINLACRDLESEKKCIENEMPNNPVFVLDDEETKLCDYIDFLHDHYKLKNSILYQLKMCRNTALHGNVTVYIGKKTYRPHSIKDLLEILEPGTGATLVFENNEPKDLAEVLQQLIYINYPITELNLKLRKEFKDAERTEVFMKSLDKLFDAVATALSSLEHFQKEIDDGIRADNDKSVQKALDAYKQIQEKLQKARNIEMKVAVAASKKTGKSVLVNCMLEQELAPTSLETATPNSCIYKKSMDDKYHFTFGEITKTFTRPQELYQEIQEYFREAQNNFQKGYQIPDMTLEYVSQENNFDTYTIFDTPGPDAAGTKHKESASSALKACDVAIFMIDYGKYLTDSEVSWLEEIKTLFNEKGKFHTLLFAINQIDRALQDKGSKSRIKSIDFIRNRLAEIDQKYQDCVVFATSALDYFNTCELKLAATTYPEIQESLQPGTNWSSALTAVNEAVEDDENLSTIVTNLQKEALGLNNQLKISPAGFHEIREYSGIPQLLSYAKYVIQSKAREEIITDITATIERLSLEIKGLLSKSGNIKILMGKSQEELEKITSILKDYGNDITTILQPKITEDDYKFLENKESESDIAAYIFREKEKDMFSFPVDFTKIIDKIGKKQTVSELMIANKIFEEFQNRQIKKIRDKKDERLYKSELSSLQLSSEELREILSDYADGEMRNYLGQKEQQATLLRDDLVALSNNRFERVEKKTEDCKTKLSKEDCELTLLQTPVWDLNLLVPVIRPSSSVSFKIDLSQVAFLEEVKGFWHSLGKFLRLRWFTEKEFDINFSEKKIKTDLERFRGKFQDDVRSSGFLEYIQKLYDSLDESMHEAADELVGKFSELTENYQKITEEFLKTVDDREKFEGEITAYQELLKNIEDINTSSEEFLRLWDTITHGNAESVKEH